MSDNSVMSGVMDALLIGACAYGFCNIAPSGHPYAFTACIFGVCHGIVGLLDLISGDAGDNSLKSTTSAIMEIFPLPLVNIELFTMSEYNNIALGHGLFMVPLLFEICLTSLRERDSESGTKTTLKHLTILGNVTSLLYLAINSSSYLYGGMAVIAFLTKYGAMWAENNSAGSGAPVTMLGHTGFFYMTADAVGGEVQ